MAEKYQDEVEHPSGETISQGVPVESELGTFAKMVDGKDGETTDLGGLTRLSEEEIEGRLRKRTGALDLFSRNLDFAVLKTGNSTRAISVLVGAVAVIAAYKLARRRRPTDE